MLKQQQLLALTIPSALHFNNTHCKRGSFHHVWEYYNSEMNSPSIKQVRARAGVNAKLAETLCPAARV